ncbi:MAG: MBL fold metallo-hydrolase [Xanthomonadales bacterium]|nr:MBL fold metallo-hydrolase [Xanthomonadales bacterium]
MKALFLTLMMTLILSLSGISTAAEISLQVLGSGGPVADDARASSGYVIGLPDGGYILIDAGGGVFQRFGEAGLNMDDLEFIGISHFHTDHSSDLPALMKSAYFGDRKRTLTIAGPSAAGKFPGLNDWLSALFAPGKGAYAYLSGYIDGDAAPFALLPIEVPITATQAVEKVSFEAFSITTTPVPHGPVPSLAFKISVGNLNIVISGDQNLSDSAFVEFVRNADLWIMPMPIPEGAGRIARNLHATPSEIAKVAAQAGVKTLLVSHFMARSLADLDKNIALIKTQYTGALLVAEDLKKWRFDLQLPQQGWVFAVPTPVK